MKQDTRNLATVNPDPLQMLVDLIADAVVERLRPADQEWISQAASPLGRIRHCTAVRRRVAKGDPSACVIGRDFKLTPAALQEELAAVSKKRVPVQAEPSTVATDLERELRKAGAR